MLSKLTRLGQICFATYRRKQPDVRSICTFSANIVTVALASQIKDADRTLYREV